MTDRKITYVSLSGGSVNNFALTASKAFRRLVLPVEKFPDGIYNVVLTNDEDSTFAVKTTMVVIGGETDLFVGICFERYLYGSENKVVVLGDKKRSIGDMKDYVPIPLLNTSDFVKGRLYAKWSKPVPSLASKLRQTYGHWDRSVTLSELDNSREVKEIRFVHVKINMNEKDRHYLQNS